MIQILRSGVLDYNHITVGQFSQELGISSVHDGT